METATEVPVPVKDKVDLDINKDIPSEEKLDEMVEEIKKIGFPTKVGVTRKNKVPSARRREKKAKTSRKINYKIANKKTRRTGSKKRV